MDTQHLSIRPPIIGYPSQLSVEAGNSLEFKLSSKDGLDFIASVVQIHCTDPNPAGPGMKLEPVDFDLQASYKGLQQEVHRGSCAYGLLPPGLGGHQIMIDVTVQPTTMTATYQTLIALQSLDSCQGIALEVCGGQLEMRSWGTEAKLLHIPLDVEIRADKWSHLRLTMNSGGKVSIGVTEVGVLETERRSYFAREKTGVHLPERVELISWGAQWQGHPVNPFDGYVESPKLSALNSGPGNSCWSLVGMWDFSQEIMTQQVPNGAGESGALTLVNIPQRAVRSSTWSGRKMDWKDAPEEYAAIRFRSDDLADCGWKTSLEIEVPVGTHSGVYGLVVSNEEGSDTIPFYVTPSSTGPRENILFLAPTLTYLAYANNARGNYKGDLERRVKAWGAYPHNADSVTMFGTSTYNNHSDGSGICISSRLRPILTMRPGYLTFYDQRGSGLRHFNADSHITDWLREKGFAFDVITDEDLDDRGMAALDGYDVVITGSHPEYYTRNMMEAMLRYRTSGGSVMYMGGNGFYWKIARSRLTPHAMEIRRAEGGMRMWASEPGEYYNQFDGEYGGMWRRNGIAPQAIAGVGFAVEGDFVGSPYLRTPESFGPEFSWLFDGIGTHDATANIGDYGLSGGGAAGFELDQAATDLGTPDYVAVVAASHGHDASFKHMPEELLTWDLLLGKPRKHGGICANMVCGIAPNGGGIFSSGSICFAGSLSHNNYANDISRIVENALRRFIRSKLG